MESGWMNGWLGKLQITILVIIYSLRIASAISQRSLVPLFKCISTIQLVIGERIKHGHHRLTDATFKTVNNCRGI